MFRRETKCVSSTARVTQPPMAVASPAPYTPIPRPNTNAQSPTMFSAPPASTPAVARTGFPSVSYTHLLAGEEFDAVFVVVAQLFQELLMGQVVTAQAQHQHAARVGVAGQRGQQLAGLGVVVTLSLIHI